MKKFFLLAIFSIILFINIYSVAASYGCFVPNDLGDNFVEDIYSYGENSLQTVLDNNGYSLDALDGQTGIQIWNKSNKVGLEVTSLDTISAYRHVFGYYTGGDLNNFVPIFRNDNVGDSSIPIAVKGSKYYIEIESGEQIGFAVKAYSVPSNLVDTFATELSLNTDSRDMAVVYDLTDEFVLAFEDWSDLDFQDIVVSAKVSYCGEKPHQEPVCADADEDGFITALDLEYFIDDLYFQNVTMPSGFIVDINNDGKFNQLDIDYLVNYLFAGGSKPICENKRKTTHKGNGAYGIIDLTGGQFCESNWKCSGWSECVDGTQTRECVDTNFCGFPYNQPLERNTCEMPNKIIEEIPAKTNYFWLWLVVVLLVIIIIVLIVNLV